MMHLVKPLCMLQYSLQHMQSPNIVLMNFGKYCQAIVVFYNVKAEHLRQPEVGPFAEAFREHLKKGQIEEVKRWKIALMEAASILGFEYADNISDIVKLKEEVVSSILNVLRPSSTLPTSKFDVFLSHRGVDTKNTFTSLLFDALKHVGCKPFVACKSLMPEGQSSLESISDIRKGVVHVAILSPRYAESKYCLDKLCEMLSSKKPLIVVFYNIKREHLRRTEGGPFAEAFCKHLKRGQIEEVKRWKMALIEVASIFGFKHVDGIDDIVKLKEEVVTSIVNFLSTPSPLPTAQHQVLLRESSISILNRLYALGEYMWHK